MASAVTVQPDMLRIFIGCSIDNYIIQPEILAGLHNSYGDLASVCYEDFSFHGICIQFFISDREF
jgi:hypothetical protein